MSEELKRKWSKVGHDFASLGSDLGKSLVSSIKTGVNAATDWARDEEKPKDNAEEEPKAEETQAEEPKAEEDKAEEPKTEK